MPRGVLPTFHLFAALLFGVHAVGLAGCALGGGPGGPANEGTEVRPGLWESTHRATIRSGLSQTVRFEVGENTESLLIELRGDRGSYVPAELVIPNGRDLVESAELRTRFARQLPGQAVWLYPNHPGIDVVEPGTYELLIRGENGRGGPLGEEAIDIRVLRKERAPQQCGLSVDFVVDESAVHASDQEALLHDLVAEMNALLSSAGITIRDFQAQRANVSSLGIYGRDITDILRAADTFVSGRNQVASNGLRPFRNGALHVLVLRDLDSDKIDGYSLGLPGPYSADLGTSLLVVETATFVERGGGLDLVGMAETTTHELGHYLGLYHTSERDEDFHDPIEDTPECAGAGSGCPREFHENLMTQNNGYPRTRITPGQGAILRAHPLCAPE